MRETNLVNGDIGNRPEYNQLNSDKMIDCSILSEIVDELMSSHVGSSFVDTQATVDGDGIYVERIFNYIESYENTPLAFSVIEKTVGITYIKTLGELIVETYGVKVDTLIHHAGTSNSALSNLYMINFFGEYRSSAQSELYQLDYDNPNQQPLIKRLATPYDHYFLFGELRAVEDSFSPELISDGNTHHQA